ncbi:phage tail protein [Metapseudomonas sp. CR1201]
MSAGAVAGGVVGGVIGFFVGGPAGAAIGFGIGMSAGGMLDPVKGPSQPGPQINDKNFQTAKYGDMLPRFYGTIAVHGNVTWIENGKLKVTIRKKKGGGKGGSAKAAPVAYYSATFILSLGLGPIAGVRRIWCSDKLIYNAGSDDLETIIASNQNATGFRLYRGTDDQLPDPRYEADVGVGNASAYRGEAYIAFYDFQLADYGNTLQGAQFKVEVIQFETDVAPSTVMEMDGPVGQGWQCVAYPNDLGSGVFAYLSTFYDCYRVGSDGVPQRIETFPAARSNGAARVVGAAQYAFGIGGAIVTDRVTYPDVNPAPNWGLWELHIDGSWALYFKRGAGLKVLSVGPYLDLADASIIAVAQFGGVLYTLDSSFVLSLRDRTSLAVLDAFPLDVFGLVKGVYLTVDEHFIWYGQNCTVLSTVPGTIRCFERTTGALVREYTGLNWPGLDSEAGAPGVINGQFSLLKSGSTFMVNLFGRRDPQSTFLADVIESEVALSSLLTPADIDTTLLTDIVRGYRVSGGSIRSALEPLQGASPFDVIQSGYQLKCVPRGQTSVMTIPWQDLGASEGDTPGDLLQESREMDSQLPARTSIKYLDAAREYAIAEQSVSRDNTPAINRVDRELPIVLTADEAAGVADVLHNLAWLERSEYAFSLPPIYLALEPADVVTIVAPWATFELRLTEINYAPNGRLECKAKPNRAALYTSNAKGGEGVPPNGNIPLPGMTILLALDIPVVDETLQNAPGMALVATGPTDGWPGAVAFRSIDNGQTWQELQGFDGKATFGPARGTLPVSTCTLIEQRSLAVDLLSGTLESITRDQMLAGQNYAAYGVDGRWEIVRFQNATLQADGSYLLSHFVRGDRGTEWATGLHQAGDWFVLLDDPDNVFVDMAVGSIGVPATYRGVTSGASIDSASDVPFTYQGVNLECLSPVYARGSRDGSGNFSGAFTRRSRLSSSWWTNGVEAPLGETTQAYEVDVMSGSTVKRTITSSTPSFSYSAANQVTDFGSAQSSITFRIYQLSSVVGRGYPLEVTL